MNSDKIPPLSAEHLDNHSCPNDITDQVTSPDDLQVCWDPSSRQLSVINPSGSVVQIDAFKYCGGDPICATGVTALPEAKTADIYTTIQLGPNDRLTIIPVGNPEAITVSAVPPLPDSNPQVYQSDNGDSFGSYGLYAGVLISAALLGRIFGPRILRSAQAPYYEAARKRTNRGYAARARIDQAHRSTRAPGALSDEQSHPVSEPSQGTESSQPARKKEPLSPLLPSLEELLNSEFIKGRKKNGESPLDGIAESYRLRLREVDREEKRMNASGFSNPQEFYESRRRIIEELVNLTGYR